MPEDISPSTPEDVVSIVKKAPETVTPTTICDLPVEILLHIFTFNTRLNFDHIHNPSRTIRHTSQVCKQWRHISLNCPALWAQSIDFKDPMVWLKKVTTRCGTCPIDMIIPSVTNSLIKSVETEDPENLHRTSPRPIDLVRRWDLIMFYDAKVLAPWFFHIPACRSVTLKIPATVWKTFNLDEMDLSHLDSLTVVEAGMTLEPRPLRLWKANTFVGETPWNLRSLTLSGCITDFDAHAFRRLSELTVQHLPGAMSLSPSQWLIILSNMPALKHLELINTTLPLYDVSDEPEMFSRSLVSLPQLEKLHLDAPLHHCSYIFKHLKFPPSCNIAIAACSLSSLDAPSHDLVAAIERHFEGGSCKEDIPLTGRSHLLAAILPLSCVINLTGPRISQKNQDFRGSLSLSVRWTNNSPAPHTPIDPLDIFSTLTTAIRKPCANVINLNLVVAITVSSKEKHQSVLDIFLSSFNRLENIEEISFSTLQFLLPFFDSRTDPDTFGEMLPCLGALSFLDVNFANYKMGDLSLLGILLSFVHSRRPITATDKSSPESDAGTDAEKRPITEMRFRLCRAVREKAVKQFESSGVVVLRDGMSFGYVHVADDEKEKK